MVRKWIFTAISAVILLTSCGQPDKPNSVQERARLSEQTDPQIVQAANAFGLELAAKLMHNKAGENVIISPVSIVQSLAMTMNGAAGPTRDQFASTLHIEGMTEEALNDGQRKLRELLLQPGPGIKLSMANSVWLQKGWPFREPYLDRVGKAYGAQLNERNLADPAVLKEINKWVSKQTNGLIPTILDEPVSQMTKLMLLNALYFDGTWETPFEPKTTILDDFTKSDGKIQRVPFMHQRGSYEYDETDVYQAIRLPYGDGQMGMLVILPQPDTDRTALAEKLFAEPDFWTERFTPITGNIALPKFRIEGNLDLKKALNAIGMSLPFNAKKADFSRLADISGDKQLFINKILHKTIVDVSERGTEAAAVTLIGVDSGSAPPSKTFELKVNRPFFFAIQDLQTGVLLFVGSVETV